MRVTRAFPRSAAECQPGEAVRPTQVNGIAPRPGGFIAALVNLDTDEFPDVQVPIVAVAVPYPGASPESVEREILVPIVDTLRREGITYRGVLYAGVMITPGGPKVIEFNARFGDPEPLKGVPGPIIGRDDGELLRYPGDGHLITFAPTGSGKGIGSVLPNCLTYPGSLVVTDPKGENAAVSGRTRRDDLGQQVAWLDPWRVLQPVGGPVGTDCFNPLDFIDPEGEDANDDAWLIGEQLVPEATSASQNRSLVIPCRRRAGMPKQMRKTTSSVGSPRKRSV